MTMQRIDLSDDSDDFETVMVNGVPTKVLKDGRRVRFRMTDSRPATLDLHDGRGGLVGHRPGFVVATDAALLNDAKAKAYDEVEAAMTSAWQNPLTGAGSHDLVGQREGDVCTINGWPGHMRCGQDGNLTCVPDHNQDAAGVVSKVTSDAGEASRIKDAAYSAYEHDLQNAWRAGR
jgi:hypothetical protein